MSKKLKVKPEQVGASKEDDQLFITPEEVSAAPENDFVNPQSEEIRAVPEEKQKHLDRLVERSKKQAIKYIRRWLTEMGVCEEEDVNYILEQIIKD